MGLDPGGGVAPRTLVSPQLGSAPLTGCAKGIGGAHGAPGPSAPSAPPSVCRATCGATCGGGRAPSLGRRPPSQRPHAHRWLCLPPACSGLLGAKGCHGSQSGPGALGFLCWFRGLLTCSNFLTQHICGCTSLQGINAEVGTHSVPTHLAPSFCFHRNKDPGYCLSSLGTHICI